MLPKIAVPKYVLPKHIFIGLTVGALVVLMWHQAALLYRNNGSHLDRFLNKQGPGEKSLAAVRYSPSPDLEFTPTNRQRLDRLESPDIWRLPDMFNEPSHKIVAATGEYESDENASLNESDAQNNDNGLLFYDTTKTRIKGPDGPVVRQPLLDQSIPGTEKIFLMIKTGQDVMWNRIPIHFLTTLTKFPSFAIYSDYPGSIAGHEVIDILATLPEEWHKFDEFEHYRLLKDLRRQNYYLKSGQVGAVLDLDSKEKKENKGWILDRFKNIPMLRHAWETDPTRDWYVFIDGDSYLNAENLVRHLSKYDPSQHVYMGHRVSAGKYAFAHGGSGVILSRHSMKYMFGTKEMSDKMISKYNKGITDLGDLAVCVMVVDEFDAKLVHVPGLTGQRPDSFAYERNDWCSPVLGFHHMGPHDIETFWEYEQAFAARYGSNTPILIADLYRDFAMPYMEETKHAWTNKNSRSQKRENVTSIEDCRKSCEDDRWCVQYTYTPAEELCLYSPLISLGEPSLSDKNVTSVWLMDRIQKINSDPCGRQTKNRSEGWALLPPSNT